MTYILADTQHRGKKWAKRHLCADEKFKVLSTSNQIRGRTLIHSDCIYLLTKKAELIEVLLPTFMGCRIFSQTDQWKPCTSPDDDDRKYMLDAALAVSKARLRDKLCRPK